MWEPVGAGRARARSFAPVVAALAVAVLAVGGCGSSDDGSASSSGSSSGGNSGGTLKLGVELPLTGPVGSVGKDAITGFELAVKQKNAAGGVFGNDVEYSTQDTESKAAQAAALAAKFGGDKSIAAIVGPIAADETAAVAPVAKQRGILSYNTTGSGVAPEGTFNGWIFRINEAQSLAAGPLMETVVQKVGNVKNVEILNYSDNEAYVGAKDIWTETGAKLGLNVSNQQFPTDTQDFGPIVSKMQGKDIDLIMVGALPPTLGPLIKQIRAAGIKAPIAGDASLFDPQVLSVSGGAAAGSYSYGTYLPNSDDPKVTKFIADYKAAYKRTPSTFAALAYDLGNILMAAAEKAGGTDRSKLRDALAGTQDYEGVTGSISYGKDGGDAIRAAIALVQLKEDGTLDEVGEIPVGAK
jgi:branched-chain amino acid transport system substrate-binding protein